MTGHTTCADQASGPSLISPDDGPGNVRVMTKWLLLVLDMYLTTDLHANNVRFMTKHFLLC